MLGSGISSMSDSAICWKPRIEEPSKPRPSVKSSSSMLPTASVMCCQVPGTSVNFRSTIRTSRPSAIFSTSAAPASPPPANPWMVSGSSPVTSSRIAVCRGVCMSFFVVPPGHRRRSSHRFPSLAHRLGGDSIDRREARHVTAVEITPAIFRPSSKAARPARGPSAQGPGATGLGPASTTPVSGFTWFTGGAGAISTSKCPATGAPLGSCARALPPSPPATA